MVLKTSGDVLLEEHWILRMEKEGDGGEVVGMVQAYMSPSITC